jgi:hypothetical protein
MTILNGLKDPSLLIISYCDIPTIGNIGQVAKVPQEYCQTNNAWARIHSALELPHIEGTPYVTQVKAYFVACKQFVLLYHPDLAHRSPYSASSLCINRLGFTQITPALFNKWIEHLTQDIPYPLDRPPIEQRFVYYVFHFAPFHWCKALSETLITEHIPHAIKGAIDAGRTDWLEPLQMPVPMQQQGELRAYTERSPLSKEQKASVYTQLQDRGVRCRLELDMERVCKKPRIDE